MDFSEKQNRPDMIALLCARKTLAGQVKNAQGVFLLLTIALAVAAFACGSLSNSTRALIALAGIGLTLAEAFWLDPWQRQRIKTTAILQEQFDCDLLGIPWNAFTVGARVSHEDVQSLSSAIDASCRETEFKDWYAPAAGNAQAHVTALVCQRSNLWYDGAQRAYYRAGLCVLLAMVVVAYLASLVATGVNMASAVLYAAPLIPFLTWSAKEIVRQKATIETVSHLKDEIEKVWRCLADIQYNDLRQRIRELQDAIYSHRASSPLIFDWVYLILRKKLDAGMSAGAQAWIDELKEQGAHEG